MYKGRFRLISREKEEMAGRELSARERRRVAGILSDVVWISSVTARLCAPLSPANRASALNLIACKMTGHHTLVLFHVQALGGGIRHASQIKIFTVELYTLKDTGVPRGIEIFYTICLSSPKKKKVLKSEQIHFVIAVTY